MQLIQLTYVVLIDQIVTFPFVNFIGYVYVFIYIGIFQQTICCFCSP